MFQYQGKTSPYRAPFISHTADKDKLFSYRLRLNLAIMFSFLRTWSSQSNVILLFCLFVCLFVFSREICGRKAVFLVIRFTSTLAWRVKSMMSLTGQRARYIYALSRNSPIYLHCALGIRALFSGTVVSFGLGHRPTHLKPREKLLKSESVRDNSGYPGRTDFRYLHWSALKVPKRCFRVRGSKNVFILTIWWLQVIILGRTVFYRCLPQGNSGLRSLLFQRGIIFVVLLNGVQSKITFIQHNWVRHPRSRVTLRPLL